MYIEESWSLFLSMWIVHMKKQISTSIKYLGLITCKHKTWEQSLFTFFPPFFHWIRYWSYKDRPQMYIDWSEEWIHRRYVIVMKKRNKKKREEVVSFESIKLRYFCVLSREQMDILSITYSSRFEKEVSLLLNLIENVLIARERVNHRCWKWKERNFTFFLS